MLKINEKMKEMDCKDRYIYTTELILMKTSMKNQSDMYLYSSRQPYLLCGDKLEFPDDLEPFADPKES